MSEQRCTCWRAHYWRDCFIAALVYLALVLLLVGGNGCTAVYVELGAGYDKFVADGVGRDRSVARLRAERDDCIDTRGTCILEYDHHSTISQGFPFNRDPDQVANQWSIVYRYPLWRAAQ